MELLDPGTQRSYSWHCSLVGVHCYTDGQGIWRLGEPLAICLLSCCILRTSRNGHQRGAQGKRDSRPGIPGYFEGRASCPRRTGNLLHRGLDLLLHTTDYFRTLGKDMSALVVCRVVQSCDVRR
jgi:hypothetical protein